METNTMLCLLCGQRWTLTRRRRENECTCAMTESSMVSCTVHGYDAPES